jgi:prolyl 4-hydroxylase
MTEQVLHKQPLICYYHNAFGIDECDFVINESEKTGKYKRSTIYNTKLKVSQIADMRTSTSFVDDDNKFHEIRTKAYELIKQKLPDITIKQVELAQIQKYEDSQFVKNHVDYFNDGVEITNNDKMATLIVYLNDDFDGGETLFNNLGYKIKPQKGSALFFNYNYSEIVNKKTRHEALPVSNGVKYIITFWVRQRPY